jgi:DNA-binding response OmpR family regulator
MESESSGYDVIRTARAQSYNPATAILTAYPNLGGNWRNAGAQSLLVKPMNTGDLLRQLEALLVNHEDRKQKALRQNAAAVQTALQAPRMEVAGAAPEPPITRKAG